MNGQITKFFGKKIPDKRDKKSDAPVKQKLHALNFP